MEMIWQSQGKKKGNIRVPEFPLKSKDVEEQG